jgi:hypothetical protein
MSEIITPNKAELMVEIQKDIDTLTKNGQLTDDRKKLYEQLVLNFTDPKQEWGRNNLRDLVVLFSESGRTPEQVYNILYVMGIDKVTAYNGVMEYTPKKITVKMNLKESLNITSKLQSLIDAMQDNAGRDSLNYNAKIIESICSNYLTADLDKLTVFEMGTLAKRLVSELNPHNYIPAVAECVKAIEAALVEHAIGIDVDGLATRLANSNQKTYYNVVIGKLTEMNSLTESEIRTKARTELTPFLAIVPEIKPILEKLDMIEGTTGEQKKTVFEQFNLKGRIKSLVESTRKYKTAGNDFTANNVITICEKHLNTLYANSSNSSETQVAAKLVNELMAFNWIEPVAESVNSIISFVNENYMSFEVAEILRVLENAKGNEFYQTAILKLNEIKNLSEAEIRENVKYKFDALTWVPEIKYLVETLNSIEGNLSSNELAVVEKVYSPITEMDGQTIFYLSGNVYGIKENEIVPIDPKTLTALYLTLIGVQESFKFGVNDLTLYKNSSTIRFELNEEGKSDFFFNGKKIETVKEANDLRNFLLANGTFKVHEMNDLNIVAEAYTHIAEFTELDFVQSVSSRTNPGVRVNIIRVSENVYVNRINPYMQINEFRKAENANQAIDLVKEYVNFDPSASLIDLLEGEAKKAAVVEAKKNDLYSKINFLKEQRNRIAETGIINESIKQADGLLISEIEKWQKELNTILK